MKEEQLFEETKKFINENNDGGISDTEVYALAYRKIKCHKTIRKFLFWQGYEKNEIYTMKHRFIKYETS